jgi:hypothetical protein
MLNSSRAREHACANGITKFIRKRRDGRWRWDVSRRALDSGGWEDASAKPGLRVRTLSRRAFSLEKNDVKGFSESGVAIMGAFPSAAFEIHTYFKEDDGFFQIADGTQIGQNQKVTLQFKRERKDAKTIISWRAIDGGPTKIAEVTKISNINNLRLLFMENKDETDTFADLRRQSP